MEPLYYTNAHSDYFKSISKRAKPYGHKEKDRKNRASITSFSLPVQMNKKYSSSIQIPNSNSFTLSPTSPVALATSPSASFPTIILVAVADYQARSKTELSISAKEHFKLISRLGNGMIMVKSIGRLSGTGLVPVSVVKIVDLDNKVGNDQRHKFDVNWLNTPDSAPLSNYSNGDQDFPGTPVRSGAVSISKPTPNGYSTPEHAHNYSYSKAQYSKESTDTVNSFEHDLKHKESNSTIASNVSSIHSYNMKQPLSTGSSPDLEDDIALENDINRQVQEDDDFLTGFDHEHNFNLLNEIENVCVQNVYSSGNRYWYRTEVFFKNGNKRFLRRYYQDFHDLHYSIAHFINENESYIDNDLYLMPKMPGPIPRPDSNNPSKTLHQRCHDLNIYFHSLFLKLSNDGYKNEIFEDWITPRFGDYDTNSSDPVTGSLDNSILFERPIKGDDQESELEDENPILGSPKIAVPMQSATEVEFNPYNLANMVRTPRSPLVSATSPIVRPQVINKNLPPIPMSDSLIPPTPVSIYRHHPSPVSKQQFNQLKFSPFSQTEDDDEEENAANANKSNNDIMQEIESELGMKRNVSIVSAPVSITGSSQALNLNISAASVNDGYSDTAETTTDVGFSQHQISGPQIRVKVFYNDGDDIFITKVPVSLNLVQLKHKIFTRIKNDFDKRNASFSRKLTTADDIFLFSKDSNGMYSAIKDDISLRNVIRGSKGKFSVRVEFD